MNRADGTDRQVAVRGRRGRGFRPNYPFSPCRRPGESVQEPATSIHKGSAKEQISSHNVNIKAPTLSTEIDDVQLLVKYSYQANESSPLGVPELTIQQGQKVIFVMKHSENDQWCKVRTDDGQEGFVPASYVMELESKPTTLPWLQKTNDVEDQTDKITSKPFFKPYVPTYQENKYELPNDLKRFFCKICNKQLNGIKPYNAHMSSKAHKEELEYYQEQ
ncbi:uncharacterized protein LOC117118917 isoform X2 [Anneissia japonica]|uniref:uncharacterized protein LOC117118917 isoform X2 n=1 Tax=Anneissia japonica TaxID=1529436 RepID=UPI0014254B68|nr:uncharacterized protein LOC117118917 isoform X2 [Anneissia japonica]